MPVEKRYSEGKAEMEHQVTHVPKNTTIELNIH